MSDPALFWHNPIAVRIVALLAVGLLVTTVWLFRRQKNSGRGAAVVCLVLSIALHAGLLIFVPKLSMYFTGSGPSQPDAAPGNDLVSVSVFNPTMDDDTSAADSLGDWSDLSSADEDSTTCGIKPLPLSEPIAAPIAALQPSVVVPPVPQPGEESITESVIKPAASLPVRVPASLASTPIPAPNNAPSVDTASRDQSTAMDDLLGDWLNETLQPDESVPEPAIESKPPETQPRSQPVSIASAQTTHNAPDFTEPKKDAELEKPTGAPQIDQDFASRLGDAKKIALRETGGDASTEAAVAAALKFLCEHQRADGAWDPSSTGAGRERSPLGLTRGSAGKQAETGLTGLALLAMLGSGHTHQSGDHQDNVYRGLVYLLGRQRSDGSLAGGATVYEAHYCHAMASLAIAEAAVMTGDPAALEATRRAVAYSRSTQHPVTGGWRYTRGDPGDLSLLGWQAIMLDAATRSGAIERPTAMQTGVARFLDSVRAGASGGLARYRPGEGPTATMTAEALATRLIIGQRVPAATIREAESVLMGELPGQTVGPDNYYYWYYATLALHQLQDEAWQRWNAAMKDRLLSTQRPDGSWPDTSVWGGYGGFVYTTSMATLCLETYYRHDRRTPQR